jgi:type II secretory pathway pseudopilin PulG
MFKLRKTRFLHKFFNTKSCSAFTLVEIIIGSSIAAFLAIVLIRILIFGSKSFQTGESKLTNLHAAAMLTLKIKGDIHNMVQDSEPGSESLPIEFDIKQADPDGNNEPVKATVKYEFVDFNSGKSIKRSLTGGVHDGKSKTYGNGNFKSFELKSISAPNSAQGYRLLMKLTDDTEKAVIDYDTIIFRRDTGSQGIKDNWIKLP